MNDIKKFFKDDYRQMGKYKARPFSFVWWMIHIVEGAAGAIALYGFYLIMWGLLG